MADDPDRRATLRAAGIPTITVDTQPQGVTTVTFHTTDLDRLLGQLVDGTPTTVAAARDAARTAGRAAGEATGAANTRRELAGELVTARAIGGSTGLDDLVTQLANAAGVPLRARRDPDPVVRAALTGTGPSTDPAARTGKTRS